MFTRFQQNVRRYPRTFTVYCTLYLGIAIGSFLMGRHLGIDFKHQALSIIGAVGCLAVFEAVSYIWFMADGHRVSLLLELLDNFEGRTREILEDEEGQDIAEYAVMLAVILAIALSALHFIGAQSSIVFSQIGSQIQ